MKVINNTNINYNEDPIRFWDFEQYESIAKDSLLYIGAHPSDSIFTDVSEGPKYFLSTEEQFTPQDSTDRYVPFVDKIFTICPLAEGNRAKREFVFFPFNEKFIPDKREFNYKYDCVYTGYASGQPHIQNILNTIRQFNYRFVSFTDQGGLATDVNTSYVQKLQRISESRITVVHNLLNVDSPQLKSRPFEAAFCKSLILCKRDRFGTIEKWFTPEKEFLYYDHDNDLREIIKYILSDFSKFEPIIHNAYIKAISQYTVGKFVEKYIGLKNI